MKMRITSRELPAEIYPGMVITYKVSPLAGIALSWMTEITHVEKEKFFVDEQRHGPYSLWHHQHLFRESEGGVLMTDIVHYRLPLSFIGDAVHAVLIRRQLTDIFDFRQRSIQSLFKNSE
jgi:ligand-binding SRPBCC domain-containing protein